MKRIKVVCLLVFVGFGIAGLTFSNRMVQTVGSMSSGPPPGFTGAPDEQSCTSCHSGPAAIGQFSIIAPENYQPGVTYQIVVRHTTADTTRRRWGFELTALNDASGAAGTFSNLSSNTQIVSDNARFYVEHTQIGTFQGQAGVAQWTFNWTSPPASAGPVRFYAAGNQADNDGTTEGDQIYTAMVTSLPPAGTPTPTSTPTATPTATPTPTPTPGFESDVAPRTSGDGIVITGDVVQMRRFATGLDTPNPATNEFQRADAAPRSTLGDGAITSGDVTQTRRYATGLDPLTDAGGPTATSFAAEGLSALLDGFYAYFSDRQIQIGQVKTETGSSVTVPVEITAYGDETGLSFTLEYDSTKLANPRVILGDGAAEGSALTVNSNEKGRIGILIDSTEAITASAMPGHIVMVNFDVAADASGDTAITLSGSLAQKGVSDAAGNSLSTRYLGGIVRIPAKE